MNFLYFLVPFLTSIDFIEARNSQLGPQVDQGVFVITHIQSCRRGAGYCILGFSCEIDNDFEPDDLGGHCRGLSAAFNPVASFVCCKEKPAHQELEEAIEALNNGALVRFNLTSATTSKTTPMETSTTPSTSLVPTTIMSTTLEEEDMTISVVNSKLDFETDSTTPLIITSTDATTPIIETTTIQVEEEFTDYSSTQEPTTESMTTTTTSEPTPTSSSTTNRPLERRLIPDEKCGILGGQAVIQAFGRAAANLLPDLVASWVTGKTSSNGSSRRGVNDKDEAKVTSTVIYCWLTAIVELETDKLICTGTLVKKDLVITTASCSNKIMTNGVDKYKVVAGDSNLMVNLPFGVQERSIKKAVIHPDFGFLTKENDIGVVQFESEMDLTETVCLLCLPDSDKKSYKESNCTITGYGRAIRNEIPTEITDGILRTTVLSILDTEECNRNASPDIDSSQVQSSYRSLEGTICLGEERTSHSSTKDTCFIALDTGSPLSCQNTDGSFELTGVLSSGTTCSKDQSIFVDVSKYLNWILNLL